MILEWGWSYAVFKWVNYCCIFMSVIKAYLLKYGQKVDNTFCCMNLLSIYRSLLTLATSISTYRNDSGNYHQ